MDNDLATLYHPKANVAVHKENADTDNSENHSIDVEKKSEDGSIIVDPFVAEIIEDDINSDCEIIDDQLKFDEEYDSVAVDFNEEVELVSIIQSIMDDNDLKMNNMRLY